MSPRPNSDAEDAFARWLDGDDKTPAHPAGQTASPTPAGASGGRALDAESRFSAAVRAFFSPPVGAADEALPPAISTGSIGLDLALGSGGYPRGHIVELYGTAGAGKTTLALLAIARVQAEGGVAALIDAEHGLDPAYARRLGVDLDNLLVCQPDSGEQAVEIGELLVRSGGVDLLAVDSVAALTPRAELEGGVGSLPTGLQAALMSQALRRWAGALRRSRASILMLNQIRFQSSLPLEDPEGTAGGRALRFYAAQRVALSVEGALRPAGSSVAVGQRVKARVVKNKLSAPFQETFFDLLFDRGVDGAGELVDAGLASGVVSERENRLYWNGRELGLDRRAARERLSESPAEAARLLAEIRHRHRLSR